MIILDILYDLLIVNNIHVKQKTSILGALLFSVLAGCGQSSEKPKENLEKTKTNNKVSMSENAKIETATLAGGCFWCTEAIYQQLEGVITVESGYIDGKVKNPTYKEVCSGLTGHAEGIEIKYDANKISFTELLQVFFKTHDPTTLNRQGADEGTQYRSGVYYHNDEQKQIAENVIADLDAAGAFNAKIVTEVKPYSIFYKAEDYHQNYYNENKSKNQYCSLVIVPKIEKFQKVFADKLKK